MALLERGEPTTLIDVAARFGDAGIADRARALLALKRCKPGRPPVYRDGDLYHLDPHDQELDDECIPAPWVYRDEPLLRDLKDSALAMEVPLEVGPRWCPWVERAVGARSRRVCRAGRKRLPHPARR